MSKRIRPRCFCKKIVDGWRYGFLLALHLCILLRYGRDSLVLGKDQVEQNGGESRSGDAVDEGGDIEGIVGQSSWCGAEAEANGQGHSDEEHIPL